MKLNRCLAVMAALIVIVSLPMEGKRITLLPLAAEDVYRLLREAGKEDAVPEGRVVTQGLAAISGLALGLAKGIGGTALLGAAALTALGGAANQQQVQTQEVCFTSRSLDEIYDGEEENVEEAKTKRVVPVEKSEKIEGKENTHLGRQVPTSPPPPTLPPTPPIIPPSPPPDSVTPTTSYTNTPTTTATNNEPITTTLTLSPTTTDGNAGTNIDTGTGTGTATDTTTQTGTGGAVNCVVVQQPPTPGVVKG